MNKIIDIDNYTPLDSDKFFFDANIWIYLYCPIGNYNKDIIKKYSRFLKKAYQAKSSIFISALALSEFFNRWTRLDFKELNDSDPSKYANYKKNFRNTEAYKNSVSTIKTTVMEHIMKIAKRVDDKFEKISIDELFKEIEVSDFNDKYYLAMANLENFKIVTHDSDFNSSKEKPVPILTANHQMLKKA